MGLYGAAGANALVPPILQIYDICGHARGLPDDAKKASNLTAGTN